MRLPKSYIKKYGISKEAWSKYKASLKKPYKKTYKGRSIKTTKRKRKVTRRKKSYRRKRKKTIPILPIVGLAAGLAEPVINMVKDPSPENIKGSLNHIALIYTGFNAIEGKFQPDMLLKGLAPLVAGCVAHKIATAIGINRHFANLPSPLDKLRL